MNFGIQGFLRLLITIPLSEAESLLLEVVDPEFKTQTPRPHLIGMKLGTLGFSRTLIALHQINFFDVYFF